MSIFKPTKVEWISFWILMPVISLATSYLLYEDVLLSDFRIFAGAFIAVYVIGFISWYLHILSMHCLAQLMPELKQTAQRLLLLIFTHFLLIIGTMITYFYGFDAVHYMGRPVMMDNFNTSLWVGIFLTAIATSLWQVEYIFHKWKLSLSEKELLEQKRLVQEFEKLKRQINPHFLFNSLNILSSLISEQPHHASYFLDELSKVYRYLLKNNDEGTTTLQNELRFIDSYYELLKIRHGDAIQLKREVSSGYGSYILPSFALHLLLENAVKHNIATTKQPLLISVYTNNDDCLVVTNNLQQKIGKVISTKIGLANIRENYRLLFGADIIVEKTGKQFSVILPLIKNQAPDPGS